MASHVGLVEEHFVEDTVKAEMPLIGSPCITPRFAQTRQAECHCQLKMLSLKYHPPPRRAAILAGESYNIIISAF